jgi:hypothetical protein
MNITKYLGLGSNFYWFQWQIVVDKGSVCWSRLAVRFNIALGYQMVEVLQIVIIQKCKYGK